MCNDNPWAIQNQRTKEIVSIWQHRPAAIAERRRLNHCSYFDVIEIHRYRVIDNPRYINDVSDCIY
jgi:hypothetical protein